MRHSASHHGHQFGTSEVGQEGANGDWRFRLTHEDAGGNIQRLSPASAHDARHGPGRDANDELHDAVVIENGEESTDENDSGEDLKRENKTDTRSLLA